MGRLLVFRGGVWLTVIGFLVCFLGILVVI